MSGCTPVYRIPPCTVCVYVHVCMCMWACVVLCCVVFVSQGVLPHIENSIGQELLEVVGWLREVQARDGDAESRENARKLLTIM